MSAANSYPTGPYDSLRDYIAALDARGRLLRLKKMDQDRYEATAFVYRMIENLGYYESPAILIEKIKIGGQWMDGPVIANLYGGLDTEAMAYGVEEITNNQEHMFRAAQEKIRSMAQDNGEWKRIKPVLVDGQGAPCKEVIVPEPDVDIFSYPWLKNNPGDAGQYINSGNVVLEDPELGRNVGTYRCQVKDAKKIGVNPEPGQNGWKFLMGMKEQGKKVANAAIVLGTDPIVFSMSSTKVAGLGEDELEFAGGFKGKPVELVKCESSDIRVPANAEMVIEGEIPLDHEEAEGPYAEMYGYMGTAKPRNFYMNIKTITHRKDPWFVNVFTGVTKDRHVAPMEVTDYLRFKKLIPNLVAIHSPLWAVGVTVLSIDKKFPGEGIAAGEHVAAGRLVTKTVITVDKDVDVLNFRDVLHAVGSRWQPHPASLTIPQITGMPSSIDPSTPVSGITSKIIIDATKQFPAEGGPAAWAPVSRTVLEEQCPEAFDLVDGKWAEYFRS
ncbi:MAG: UbiD family decarboxylase [Gammaproteobacteria bacterium]|nr:UbiD family decarboxylase [Gammaproteobacteria bacterium]